MLSRNSVKLAYMIEFWVASGSTSTQFALFSAGECNVATLLTCAILQARCDSLSPLADFIESITTPIPAGTYVLGCGKGGSTEVADFVATGKHPKRSFAVTRELLGFTCNSIHPERQFPWS